MRIACVVIVVFAAGCAPAIRPPSISSADMRMTEIALEAQQMAALGQVAREAAERECAPLRSREPGFAEERAVGQELAVSLAARSGRFYLDGATELDPQKLNDALAARRVAALPEGGKNAVSAHVAIVGRNLARFSARPDLPWVFGVLENENPATLNTPGGYVFVTTGLLKKMTNEAQLAGVLAHEIDHVVRKDVLKKYIQAKHNQCIAARYAAFLIEHGGTRNPAIDEMARYARNFDGSGPAQADAGFQKFIMDVLLMGLQSGNDKESEFQADKGALELLSFAGYDALEYEKFVAANAQPSHPAPAERAAKLEALRKGELKDFVHGTAKPDLSKVFARLAQ